VKGRGNTAGHGVVLEDLQGSVPDESLLIERLSEEHATVRNANGSSRLAIGDLVRIIPNHSCVVSNMVETVWLVDGETVLDRLPVAARGRIT
jgi:D-serine deaminase-like pyridoxal phosphate-dependent protein